MKSRVGIVIPTLGKRTAYLAECLSSIKQSSSDESTVYAVIVAPKSFNPSSLLNSGLIQEVIEDPGTGLAGAINVGLAAMPAEVEYMNWLGDDDLLASGSIDEAIRFLDNHPKSVLVFGSCDYIDEAGKVVWTNRSGAYAVPLLRFGPDLIPQPGALFRKDSFLEVGGLNQDYDWAFDFDLFIKLSKVGKVNFIDRKLSSFRWHPDSLSVEHRTQSVEEASSVRISHLPALLRPLSWVWEYPVKKATLTAGKRLTERVKKRAK